MIESIRKIKYDILELKNAVKNNDLIFIKDNINAIINYQNEEDGLWGLLSLASSYNYTKMIKFFLSSTQLIDQFGEELFSKINIRDVLRNAAIQNNIEILIFLLESNKLSYHPSVYSIDPSHLDRSSHVTSEFIKQYEEDIVYIKKEFELIETQFQQKTYEDGLDNLIKLLSNNKKEVYQREFSDRLEELFYFSFQQDTAKLTEFLLPYMKESSFEETFSKCKFKCIDSVELLIKKIDKKNVNNTKISVGLFNALYEKDDALVKFLLNKKYQYIEFDLDLEKAFSIALSLNSFEIIPLLVEKSLKKDSVSQQYTSSILALYPYQEKIFNIIPITKEENIIKAIPYLLKEDTLKPQNYKNYQPSSIDRPHVSDQHIISHLLNKGYVYAVNEFIDKGYYKVDEGFFHEGFIKNTLKTQDIECAKKVVDYILNNYHIDRTKEFHLYLKESIKESPKSPKEVKQKEIEQYVLDYYDNYSFNELLKNKTSHKDNIKSVNKKKI